MVDSTDGRLQGRCPPVEARLNLDGRRPGATVFTVEELSEATRRSIDVRRGDRCPPGRADGPPSSHSGVCAGLRQDRPPVFRGRFASRHRRHHPDRGRPDHAPRPGMLSTSARPGATEAYVVWWRYSEERTRLHVSRVSTETLAILESLQLPVDGLVVGLPIGPRPPPLSDLNVVVDQRVATLTWTIGPAGRSRPSQVSRPGFTPGATAVRLPSPPARRASPSPACRRALLRPHPLRKRHRRRGAVQRGGGGRP